MKNFHILFAVLLISNFSAISFAGPAFPEQYSGKKEEKKKNAVRMSKEELMNLALSAAPESIAENAGVIIPDEEGSQFIARIGTNGFVCFADATIQTVPYPFCADRPAIQWMQDFANGAPKPTNSSPGVVYMAKGGAHYEKDGKALMKPEEGAKVVTEPPHWMLYWPFDTKTSGIPPMPGPFGTYIMGEGTPYSHLMIYQDPGLAR